MNTGLVAVEAQLASTAQRHLLVRFGPVQVSRGDGWVLFEFQPMADDNELKTEVQRLTAALARDITGRSSLRLLGEASECDFATVGEKSVRFAKYLARSSADADAVPADLNELPNLPAVHQMLEMLYADVSSDSTEGVQAVTDFPKAMCPTGSRMDVIFKNTIGIKAYTQTDLDIAEDIRAAFARKKKKNKEEGGEDENIELSMLQNSYSVVKLPPGPIAKVWIDTKTLAHAFSSYASASIENELPPIWRSKSFTLLEALELLEQVNQSLIQFWNSTPTHNERQKTNAVSLLSIVSGDLREYIKSQVLLHSADWRGPWRMSLPDIQAALQLCRRWNKAVLQLTKRKWKGWDGGTFHDESLDELTQRLHDVVRVRELLNSVTLLGEKVPDTLQPEIIFDNASMIDARSTPRAEWAKRVEKFDNEFSFLDPKLRSLVKQKLFQAAPSDSMVRSLMPFSMLLQRGDTQKAMEKELQGVAAYLIQQMEAAKTRFENNDKRASTDLQKLRAAKSCEAECASIPEVAYRLLGPGASLTEDVSAKASLIISECETRCEAVIKQWRDNVEAQCKKMVDLEEAVVIQVDSRTNPTLLRCSLNPTIQQFINDTQNFRCWAGDIPHNGSANGAASDGSPSADSATKRLQVNDSAENTIRACEQLFAATVRTQQAVANFNTVLSQIIPCTRKMLANAMERSLAQILYADTKRRVISLVNYQELEGLNMRFQNTVETLSSENRHIRRFHGEMLNQVIALHSMDLTKHMDHWRSAVDTMRSSFEEFIFQHKYTDYDEWRRFLDCQIYKGLEYQYRRGLESLHENMEEFNVELVFKQGMVQFKPSFEAIREAYYIKLREFVSVPNRFRGLQPKRESGGVYEIYPQMPLDNTERIVTVHTKAIELFNKLTKVRKAFRSYIVIGLCGVGGMPDLDTIVEQWAQKPEQFAQGFETVKEHMAKLEKIEDTMRVDCFAISTVPVKATVEEQLHRLEESLLNAMRKQIQQSVNELDNFVFNASNVIERQPTTMDEVGEANMRYKECQARMPELEIKFNAEEEQNRELRTHSGASIDVSATKARWEHLREAMSSHTKVIESAVSKMRVSLDSLIQKFLKDVQRFSTNWEKQKSNLVQAFKDKKTGSVEKLLGGLKSQKVDMEDLKTQGKELESKCEYFNQPKPNFSMLDKTMRDVESTSTMWGLYDQFQEQLSKLREEDWLTFRAHTYQFDDFCKEWKKTLDAQTKDDKDKDKEENVIPNYLLKLLKDWNDVLPLLKFIRGDGWMTEHWNEMFRLLGIDKSMTSATLKFGNVLDCYEKVLEKQGELKQLQARAQGEIQLREALQDLRTWGLEATFTLILPSDGTTKVKLITEWKDVMTQVSDNLALIGSLKDSPFFQHFADEASGWEAKLVALTESLTLLNSIQRKWTYLEPIFARGALPQEQARFKRVDKEFVGILREVDADPRVMSLTTQTDFNDKLKGILEQIDRCQKSLMEYLDAKRDKLPRFYFISDEDLLEILGHSQNPSVIQAHLKKLFMGIHKVKFNEKETAITHMFSADEECVPLSKPVAITDNDVEDWLIRLDGCMKATLQEQLIQCTSQSDVTNMSVIQQFPSQILQVALQIHFAKYVENALNQKKPLNEVLAWSQKQLDTLTSTPGDIDNVSSLKIKALILDIIHNVEIVQLLIARNVQDVKQWFWQKQLRYYLNDKNLCFLQMVDTVFDYTYEYQGNAAKLVHTPLTDKCYLVLTKGMGLGYGGNPYGPAGTGKTESVKALGSAMGRQVLVFNCDEGIDFKAMGRIFVGIVKCGAWGCFDEFNRLKIDQLSAISQMIQVIQEALKSREPNCVLLHKNIEVNPNAGIFVTLNPAGKGYGGRTKLPDNLKQLFREVAMSVPDNELITATMLLSEGFHHAKALSTNVVELYKLCKQLMSKQQHYDWGLRPLKAVLRLGGTLQQKWKRSNPGKSTTVAQESELLVQSLNINTLSKLTFDDARLFTGLLRDIFPGVESREVTYGELESAIKTAVTTLGLQTIPSQTRKVLQLYEAMNQRMGVVLVGPSGSGKSTLLNILRKALEVMKVEVPLHVMNPKAMPRRRLLGYMDPDTREWYDGVLTVAARDAVKAPTESRPWIWCDGDIDPEWIESLNSVLDDNKLLTMPNGVRIQFGSNVNFVFETHSLEFASPATVSRMGVLFLSEKDVQMDSVVESVMATQPNTVRTQVTPWIKRYAYPAIDEAIRLDMLSVPTTRMGLLNACLNHTLAAKSESDFVFSLIRGLGSALTPDGAAQLARFLFKTSSLKPVSDSRPLDTYWDVKKNRLAEYTADLSTTITAESFLKGQVPMIMTSEVQRMTAVLAPLLADKNCKPIFVVGPEGCGKGSLLHHCLAAYKTFRSTSINCSAQTDSVNLVRKIEQVCTLYSTNTGRVYRPRECERAIIVLRGVNLPKPDKYGTVELHSILQQMILYRGFYNEELEWIGLEGVQFVATMNPTVSAGRYPVAPRLLAVVNVVTTAYPSKASLTQVYATYWGGILKSSDIGQGKEYDGGQQLANFNINVYDKIRKRFEGEAYAHFQFCPRHLTNWLRSVLMYKMDTQTTLPAVLAYEANRVFMDCLPTQDDRVKAEKILAEQLASIGYSAPKEDRFSTMFVTWFNDAAAKERKLEQKKYDDVVQMVENGLVRYSREFKEMNMIIIPEVITWITRVDRVFLRQSGHLIVVGRPGVGRRDTVIMGAYMQRMEICTLNMTTDYCLKNFRNDLRTFIQRATTQNVRMTLLLEDQNIVDESFLELVNGLVSSGEVPGLFTSEEMEAMYNPLREDAANDGFIGPIYQYYLSRLQKNLRVSLIMDDHHELFLVRLQANPGLLSNCTLLWMGSWSGDVTKTMCKVRLKDTIAELEANPANKGFHLHRELYAIHEGLGERSTPKHIEVMTETYQRIMRIKSKASGDAVTRLETGLAKLKEGEASVDTIKKDVAKKKEDVERMQKEADNALNEIQKNMQNSQEQRDSATELQEKLKEENKDLVEKREKVESELSSIRPMMEAARDAVSTIRTEQLNEIRSLKSPPEPIRDVLEAVLALLGVTDVSWQSMRKFLGERGSKERILDFNVNNVTPQIRQSVSKLLQQKSTSFKPEVIHRASVAAAPMAEWVKAMVEYSTIMERIAPLTRQLEQLEQNQKEGEEKLEQLRKKLKKIDKLVEGLREEFAKKCKDAEVLRTRLEKAESELNKAQELLDKLSGEKTRWAADVEKIREANVTMPKRALVAAAFLTYLGRETEDARAKYGKKWSSRLGFDKPVNVTEFMRTESELLQFKAEGLPGDDLSLENAIVTLDTVQTPLVIDPANQAIEWAKTHLRAQNAVVEVTSLYNERFAHTLELSIRFGKTLLVTEVGSIEPILYPILRKELISAGAKRIVQVGNKAVDWQDSFRIILFSRSTDMKLPPDAAALLTDVNFSVTSTGLESQLLGLTIKHEKPELEEQKVELLKKEEALKVQLSALEERLLRELADSQGDLLENTQLVTSLNEVKSQAANIQSSLEQSQTLQKELDEKREVYRPFGRQGSMLYFLMKDLEQLNHMYQYGLQDFILMFTKTLKEYKGDDSLSKKIPALIENMAKSCFHSVSVSVFKRDRLAFGLHLLQGFYAVRYPANLWSALVGSVGAAAATEKTAALPSWAPLSSKPLFTSLASSPEGMTIIDKWNLSDTNKWNTLMSSPAPESSIRDMPTVEQLLLINIFRPDRMPALATAVILKELKLTSLTPNESLQQTILRAAPTSPILLITSSGADPSLEVQDIANQTIGKERFHQIALGGGQTDEAMQQLRRSAAAGDWLFLKNLHLVLDWASVLEKELCAMPEPHKDFHLIVTTEEHQVFPSVLLRLSVKVTVESPPGVKQNLLRTYQTWDKNFIGAQSGRCAALLFGLAWFHGIVQERRTYVPQGWVQRYGFSPADLKAASDVLISMARQKDLDWITLKGVMKNCIYGGRLDNPFDEAVLVMLLDTYFTPKTLFEGAQPLYHSFMVPGTNEHSKIVSEVRDKLPDVDPPALFHLPDNSNRAVQEHIAAALTEDLRVMATKLGAAGAGDSTPTEGWKTLLAPVLEMWKSCGVTGAVANRAIAATGDPAPMEVFFVSEVNLLAQLLHDLEAFFESMQAMSDGTLIPPPLLREEALEFAGGRVPGRWMDRMDGPREAKLWLTLLKRRYTTVQGWMKEPLSSSTAYDLSNFMRPDTFFNALRQHTARQSKVPLVDLRLAASVVGDSATSDLSVSVTVLGSTICIQGAVMKDGKLAAPAANAPSSVPLGTNVKVGWVSADKLNAKMKGHDTIQVYNNPLREQVVFPLAVPCASEAEHIQRALAGVACFILTV